MGSGAGGPVHRTQPLGQMAKVATANFAVSGTTILQTTKNGFYFTSGLFSSMTSEVEVVVCISILIKAFASFPLSHTIV